MNLPPNIPAADREARPDSDEARPARRVVPKLADVFHELPVGAVAGRPAAAHRAHGRRADPLRRHHVLRGRRGEAGREGRLRVGSRLGEGAGGRAVLVRRRHHRLGRRAPGAGAREPRGVDPRVRFVADTLTPSRSSSSPSWRAAGSRGRSTSTAPGSGVRGRVPARGPLRRRRRSPWTTRTSAPRSSVRRRPTR